MLSFNRICGFSYIKSHIKFSGDLLHCTIRMSFRNHQYRNKGYRSRRSYLDEEPPTENPFRSNDHEFRNREYRNMGHDRSPYLEKGDPFPPRNGNGREVSRGGKPPPGLVNSLIINIYRQTTKTIIFAMF